MKTNKLASTILCTVVAFSVSVTALAESTVEELAERLERMQQEMDQLKQQLKKSATKEEIRVIKEDVATAGEWLQPDTLIHMAGYADVGYTDSESEDGSFNVGTFAPIFHFQYRDLVMLESELEFTVGDDGETETNLEYLTIDWFINDYMVLVGGKFLSPIGQFRQNLHPSWINKLPSAPPGFGHDGAAPVSDVGLQLRGGFPIGTVRTNYAVYVSNGPELITEFEDGEYELDGVEAEGFGSDGDGEKVVGGRLGIIPFVGFELGLSAASGKATVTSIEDGDSSLLNNEAARDYDVLGRISAGNTSHSICVENTLRLRLAMIRVAVPPHQKVPPGRPGTPRELIGLISPNGSWLLATQILTPPITAKISNNGL